LRELGPNDWAFLEIRDPNCRRCDLGYKNNPEKVCLVGQGPRDAELFVVGEAPGRREVEEDIMRPFAGPAGKYLDLTLENVGLDRDHLFITNVLCCHPPQDRDPTPQEMKACKIYLEAQIREVKPKRILCLGGIALKALAGKSGVAENRGRVFYYHIDEDHTVEVYPTYHPSYIRSNPRFYPVLYTDLLRLKGNTRKPIETHYIPVEDMTTFRAMIRELLTSQEVSFDLETEGLDPWAGGHIICISLSNKEGKAYIVPLEPPWGPWTEKELKDVYRLLEAVLSNLNIHIIAFNSKFDLQWLWTRNLKAKCDWDPMIAASLLDENLPHSLEACIQIYIDPEFHKLDPKNITTWPWKKIWPYAGGDADWTLRLSHVLRPRLAEEKSSETLFQHLVLPAQAKVLPKLELDGIYVHEDKLEGADVKCTEEISKWTKEIKKYVPESYVPPVKSKKSLKKGFNPNSTKQLADLLFEVLHLPPGALTGDGDYSTAEAVLMELKGKHSIIEPILELRKFAKYKSTYIDAWRVERDSNGFIHPHYHLKTVTGRLSSTEPNLQQVPRDTFIRSILGAPPGWVLLSFDFIQIEMKLAGHYARDENLIKAYQNKEDIHLMTAILITGLLKEQITKELRKKAKAVNFGLIFGMSAEGLQQYAKEKYEVDMTLDEAIAWRVAFFKKYWGLPVWHRKQKEEVREKRQVVSMIGRVRHLNNILSSDRKVVAEAERQGINSPVQGLASDFNLLGAVEVDKVLPPTEGKLCGLVHDCTLYLIREDRVAYWKERIKYILENPPLHKFTDEELLIPLEVEVTESSTWE